MVSTGTPEDMDADESKTLSAQMPTTGKRGIFLVGAVDNKSVSQQCGGATRNRLYGA